MNEDDYIEVDCAADEVFHDALRLYKEQLIDDEVNPELREVVEALGKLVRCSCARVGDKEVSIC